MRGSPDGELTLNALQMAFEQRCRPRGVLHHSDRGAQYSSGAYLDRIRQYGMRPSFSRIGECWDNAVVESFFHTLKTERVPTTYASRQAARRDIFDYIEVWYNHQRRHSTIGYLSPADYEARL